MASIEFLTERINKAQETISKKENTIVKKQALIVKKIAKLEKMGISYTEETEACDHRDNSEAFWTICDIGNLKDDIRRGSREIEEKKASLAKYQQDLETEQHKANSRNVQIILDFIEAWKQKTIEFYQSKVEAFLKAKAEYEAQHEAYWAWVRSEDYRRASNEERSERSRQDRKARKAFNGTWAWISIYMYRGDLDLEALQKDLDREGNRKYDFIIARTNEIVTEITDASYLHIADNGELNGWIIGTTGTAAVNTIGAGGYNIQRFHFRTLVKRIA